MKNDDFGKKLYFLSLYRVTPWCHAHRGVVHDTENSSYQTYQKLDGEHDKEESEFSEFYERISRKNRIIIRKYYNLFVSGHNGFES